MTSLLEASTFNSQFRFAEVVVIFSYLAISIALMIILMFKSSNQQFFKEKRLVFKMISLLISLLRSVGVTLILILLTANIVSYSSKNSSTSYIEIFFEAGSFLLLGIIQYIQAYFFNL